MAVRKPDNERQRRNKPKFETQRLVKDGKKRGPELPTYPWCQPARDWYEDFRYSANAQLCEESDWQNVLVCARLVDRYWSHDLSPSEMTTLAGEIRRRMAPYGYTYEDRVRFGIEIIDPDEVEEQVQEAAQQVVNYAELLNQEFAKRSGD